VDRIRAQQVGLTQRQVASNLLISLSSSGQTAPNFWLNPQSGISYTVQVMTPPDKITSFEGMTNTPVTAPGLSTPQLFGNLVTARRQTSLAVVNHYNLRPVADVYAAPDQRDLDAGRVVQARGSEVGRLLPGALHQPALPEHPGGPMPHDSEDGSGVAGLDGAVGMERLEHHDDIRRGHALAVCRVDLAVAVGSADEDDVGHRLLQPDDPAHHGTADLRLAEACAPTIQGADCGRFPAGRSSPRKRTKRPCAARSPRKQHCP